MKNKKLNEKVVYIVFIFLFLICTGRIDIKINKVNLWKAKTHQEEINLIVPTNYMTNKKIEVSDEIIQAMKVNINHKNESNPYRNGEITLAIPMIANVFVDGKETVAFIAAIVNESDNVYSNMVYKISAWKMDTEQEIFMDEAFSFSKESYGELNKNEAFLFILPFPEGLPQELYQNPGDPIFYNFFNSIVSQEVDGKFEKNES